MRVRCLPWCLGCFGCCAGCVWSRRCGWQVLRCACFRRESAAWCSSGLRASRWSCCRWCSWGCSSCSGRCCADQVTRRGSVSSGCSVSWLPVLAACCPWGHCSFCCLAVICCLSGLRVLRWSSGHASVNGSLLRLPRCSGQLVQLAPLWSRRCGSWTRWQPRCGVSCCQWATRCLACWCSLCCSCCTGSRRSSGLTGCFFGLGSLVYGLRGLRVHRAASQWARWVAESVGCVFGLLSGCLRWCCSWVAALLLRPAVWLGICCLPRPRCGSCCTGCLRCGCFTGFAARWSGSSAEVIVVTGCLLLRVLRVSGWLAGLHR